MEAPGAIRGLIRQSGWLLRIASLLVPRAQRKVWYGKRYSEVWHWLHFLHESGRLNFSTKLELGKHLRGLFVDALWLRFDRNKARRLAHRLPRSPRFCLAAIAVFLLAVVIVTGFAPTIRWAFSPLPQKAHDRLADVPFIDTTGHDHSNTLLLSVSHRPEKSAISIQNKERQGVQIYLIFTMLAFFTSLGILAFRAARSGSARIHLELRNQLYWWLFFTAKTLLLLATCFFLSLEGTRRVFLASTGAVPASAGAVSSWFLLVTTVLAVTWSLHDQGRRCHICLKRLSHASYVGVPARLLLDWWGTEWVCSEGHGMLHLPEMKASWLADEHWIQLDDSWKSLFEADEAKVS